MERKILCPRCRRVLTAQVRFPAFRPIYLHEGAIVFQGLCDSCRQLKSPAGRQGAHWEQARGTTDLPSQLEDLLNEVWRCEADWRLLDRLDLMDRRPPGMRRSA